MYSPRVLLYASMFQRRRVMYTVVLREAAGSLPSHTRKISLGLTPILFHVLTWKSKCKVSRDGEWDSVSPLDTCFFESLESISSLSEVSLNLMLNYTYLSFLKVIQGLLLSNTHAGTCAAFKTEYHTTASPKPPIPLPENRFITLWNVSFQSYTCAHREVFRYFCDYLVCLRED